MRNATLYIMLLITFSLAIGKIHDIERTDTLSTPNVLKEIVVKSRKHQVLHILAYVRDYSTLSTYGDTITLFREKWVDYMLPTVASKKFEGWRTPRILKAKSYYRFTDACGLDSVSDEGNQHFSWSDWVGIIDNMDIPASLHIVENSTDTVFGKYSPSEIWTRYGDNLTLDVDVLADTLAQRWVPDFSLFFKDNIDFEKFHITYNFSNVYSKVFALDLSAISCSIESRGRGRDMFMFNRRDEPFFVTTKADFYIVDREFMSFSEAKKWREKNVLEANWFYTPPSDAMAELSPDISALISRVDSINHDAIRLEWKPNPLFVSTRRAPVPLHKRYFKFIKSLIGL